MDWKSPPAVLLGLAGLGLIVLGALVIPDRDILEAGSISGARATGIEASFTRKRAGLFNNGIETHGVGGVCVVFHAGDLGFRSPHANRCTKDSDCGNTPNESGVKVGYSYCNTTEQQCWVKPISADNSQGGEKLCRKSIDTTPPTLWQRDVQNAVPASNTVAIDKLLPPSLNLPRSGKIRARVVTCLQTKDAVPQNGCASSGPKSVREWGRITPL